jgi:GNAT superfamily N-acetyltransferase
MTAAATELPVVVRPMREGDRPFVFETTVKVRWPRTAVSWHEWSEVHGAMVDHWIRDGFVRVAESDGVLLGFVVVAPKGVAMLYVKRGFRGDGIGLRLLQACGYPDGGPPRALLPTPSWARWCDRRGIAWERGAC